MYNVVNTLAPSVFDRIFFIFAGNEDNHKVSDKFKIQEDPTMDRGVSCPRASEKIPIDLQWEKCCDHSSAFVFDWNFFILAGSNDMHESLDEFQFQPDLTTDCGVTWP